MSRWSASTAMSPAASPATAMPASARPSSTPSASSPCPTSARAISGVQAGDYDYAETMSGDLYDQLSADPSVVVRKGGTPIFGLFFTNSAGGHPEGQLQAPPGDRDGASAGTTRCGSRSGRRRCGTRRARSSRRATSGTPRPGSTSTTNAIRRRPRRWRRRRAMTARRSGCCARPTTRRITTRRRSSCGRWPMPGSTCR